MKLNIPTKVSVLVMFTILFMVGSITYLFSRELQRRSLEFIELRAEALAQTILSDIENMDAELQLDRSTAHQVLGALSSTCQWLYNVNKEKDIVHIAIIDIHGKILAHHDTVLIGRVIDSRVLLDDLGWPDTVTVLDEMIYHTLVPIIDSNDTYIGAIDIGYPKVVSDEIFKQFFLTKTFWVLIGFLVVTFLIILGIVFLMVTKPIQYLIRVGNQMTQGHLIDSIQFASRGDEMARLGAVFVSLSAYFHEVTELATQIATGSLAQQQVQKRSKRDVLGYALQQMLTYLQTVATNATKIAEGDLTMTIPLRSERDTFGRALHQMMTYLREMADAATTISTGDLRSQIVPRSEHDVLGNAFHRMTTYLTTLATAATAIANGNLQQDVQPETAHDVLGNAFHTMAVQLRENFEKIQQEVAERTRAQEALQKLNEELEHRVEERTLELKAAYEEIKILNTQLKKENVRMATEMELARKIQTSLLPLRVQDIHPDFEIAATMLPAEEVGGDYYDIALDKEDTLWFGIGDVSGHGVTPGLIMMMAQTVHTTITTNFHASARDIIIMLNKVLYKNVHYRLNTDHFMTFTTLKYLGDGRFQHAGAHLDFVVYRQQTQTCERIDTPGTWLNFIPDIEGCTENSEFGLELGDVLVLYTDGLTEAMNRDQELLDIHRFMDIVETHARKAAEPLQDAIIADVMDWCHGKRADDMSLVVARRIQ